MGARYTSGADKKSYKWAKTVKGTHFTEAIAQNAQETETINNFFPTNNVDIVEVVVISTQRLKFQLYFYDSDTFNTADPDTDALIDDVTVNLATSGEQIAGTGLWRLGIRLDNPIKYTDTKNKNALYLGLIPRSGGKLITPGGDLVIKIASVPAFGG